METLDEEDEMDLGEEDWVDLGEEDEMDLGPSMLRCRRCHWEAVKIKDDGNDCWIEHGDVRTYIRKIWDGFVGKLGRWMVFDSVAISPSLTSFFHFLVHGLFLTVGPIAPNCLIEQSCLNIFRTQTFQNLLTFKSLVRKGSTSEKPFRRIFNVPRS